MYCELRRSHRFGVQSLGLSRGLASGSDFVGLRVLPLQGLRAVGFTLV